MEGNRIVSTKNALRLNERGLAPVLYIPRNEISDVEFIKIGIYHCPFKGYADLYDLKHGPSRFEKAAWSYVRPYDDLVEIENHVAFYSNKVQFIRITGG